MLAMNFLLWRFNISMTEIEQKISEGSASNTGFANLINIIETNKAWAGIEILFRNAKEAEKYEAI